VAKDKGTQQSAAPATVLQDVRNRIAGWSAGKDLGVAIDLLSFGFVHELRADLAEPARTVLDRGGRLLTPQLTMLAQQVLGTERDHEYFAQKVYYQRAVQGLKEVLTLNPKNPLAWVDLARVYTIQGQLDSAKRAMRIALSLAPQNRFVLRSETRFWLHLEDPERALSILRKSPRTQEDPWLLASMISVETVLNRAPQFFKQAQQMLEKQRFSPAHLAELGAAVGTLHLNDGLSKAARKTFNIALQNPNDNAVAQAVWVANEYAMSLNIMPEWLNDRFSAEANYYALEKAGNYRAALNAACSWFEDEPFSIRPLRAGAFSAAILGKYQVAQDQMEQALELAPDDIECKNNLVFALAGQDMLQDAYSILNEVSQTELSKNGALSGHTLANWGMLFYRSGDLEHGRELYERAQSVLISHRENIASEIATAFWVQEAKRAADPQLSQITANAQKALSGQHSAAARTVLERAVNSTEASTADIAASIPSAIKWTHDRDKNVLVLDKLLPFKI
jgi:Tfp pilus assembly protein PilF